MQSQLEDIKGPKKRKRVAVDLNTKFANVDSIKEAIANLYCLVMPLDSLVSIKTLKRSRQRCKLSGGLLAHKACFRLKGDFANYAGRRLRKRNFYISSVIALKEWS